MRATSDRSHYFVEIALIALILVMMAKLNGTLTLRRNRAKRGLPSNKRGRPKKHCRMAQEAQEAPERKEQGPKAS